MGVGGQSPISCNWRRKHQSHQLTFLHPDRRKEKGILSSKQGDIDSGPAQSSYRTIRLCFPINKQDQHKAKNLKPQKQLRRANGPLCQDRVALSGPPRESEMSESKNSFHC